MARLLSKLDLQPGQLDTIVSASPRLSDPSPSDLGRAEANVAVVLRAASMNGGLAGRLCVRAPGLLLADLPAWLEFLSASGFTDAQVQHMLCQRPDVFASASLVDAGNAMLHMKQLGLKDQDSIIKLAVYYPQVLAMDKASIGTLMSLTSRFQGPISTC